MTEIKQDAKGLYVMVDGQRARPGPVLGDHGYTTDGDCFTAGQQVRAKLVPDTRWVRLRAGGNERHWSASTADRAAGAAAHGPFKFAVDQHWRRREGGVVRVTSMQVTARQREDGYVVVMSDGGARGPRGQFRMNGNTSGGPSNLDLVALA